MGDITKIDAFQIASGAGGGGATSYDYTAGEDILAGDAVYLKASDGKVYVADNDSLSTAYVIGFSRETRSIDQSVAIQFNGKLNQFAGLTENELYYLSNNGAITTLGNVGINKIRCFVGIAIDTDTLLILLSEPQYKRSWDGLNIGDIFPSANPNLGRLQGCLAFGCEKVGTSDFAELYAVVGDSFETARTAAGWAASGAGYFYPTPPAGYFPRPAYPDFEFDYTDVNVDDTINYTAHPFRTGTPVLYIEGSSAITGLTDGTVYYIRDHGTDEIKLSDTEAHAIAGTDIINITDVGTGTGHKLRHAYTLEEDAFQEHSHYLGVSIGTGPHNGVNAFSYAGANFSYSVNFANANGQGVGKARGEATYINAPKVSDIETRPAQVALYYYIKASHVGVTGEPVTATRYSTGWVANSDWTNAELTVTHNLGADFTDLITKVFISTDGTEANSFEVQVTTYDDSSVGNRIYGISAYYSSINEIKFRTGGQGIMHVDTSDGSLNIIDTESWYYKVVVYKPSVLASYTGSRNTVVNIGTSSTDQTVKIPSAASIDYPIFIKRVGTGTGQVLLSFESGEDETDVSALEGDGGYIELIASGGKWYIRDYYDFGDNGSGEYWEKFGDGRLFIRNPTLTLAGLNSSSQSAVWNLSVQFVDTNYSYGCDGPDGGYNSIVVPYPTGGKTVSACYFRTNTDVSTKELGAYAIGRWK